MGNVKIPSPMYFLHHQKERMVHMLFKMYILLSTADGKNYSSYLGIAILPVQ